MPEKPAPRRRGAQPGNRNALKHGFYTRRFPDAALSALAGFDSDSLSAEVELLRLQVRRLAEASLADEPDLAHYLSLVRAVNLSISILLRLFRAIPPRPQGKNKISDPFDLVGRLFYTRGIGIPTDHPQHGFPKPSVDVEDADPARRPPGYTAHFAEITPEDRRAAAHVDISPELELLRLHLDRLMSLTAAATDLEAQIAVSRVVALTVNTLNRLQAFQRLLHPGDEREDFEVFVHIFRDFEEPLPDTDYTRRMLPRFPQYRHLASEALLAAVPPPPGFESEEAPPVEPPDPAPPPRTGRQAGSPPSGTVAGASSASGEKMRQARSRRHAPYSFQNFFEKRIPSRPPPTRLQM